MYYTYVHRRKSDNLIFYVGKGTRKRAWDQTKRNEYWKNTKNKHGIIVEIWAEFDTSEEALEYEKQLIAVLLDWMPLTNMTLGGDGASPGVANGCYGKFGPAHPAYGNKMSDELKRKLSQIKKGVPRPPHVIEALRRANTNKAMHPNTRKALDAARETYQITDETRQKLSRSSFGSKNGMFGRKGALCPRAQAIVVTFPSGESRTFPTGDEACKELNLSRTTFSSVLTGKRQVPATWNISKIEKTPKDQANGTD